MRHLVLGGTGTVGGAVVQGLLEAGQEVRVPTRSQEKAASLPDGAVGVVGDLREPGDYGKIFRDFDRMFLLNAVSLTELHEGLAALNEARRAGAERIVYLSVHDAEKGRHIPHFSSKLAVEDALRDGGVPSTILRPNNFFQNDLWSREALTDHGIYPQPIGDRGLSRVDVGDIADAAVRALTRPDPATGTYALVGPDVLTGGDCAEAWAEALDRDVRYAGDDLDAWAARAREQLPGWMVYDFRLMYRTFQEQGLAATEDQLDETREILGRAPRSFGDFVEETAAAWS